MRQTLYSLLLFFCSFNVYSHSGLHDLLVIADSSIKAYPDSAELFLDRGEWYRLHGDFTLAEKDYQVADSLKPHWNAVNYCRASLLKASKKNHEALKFIKKYLEEEPKSINGMSLKGEVLLKLGRKKEANKTFLQLIRIHKSPPPHLYYETALLFLNLKDTASSLHWLDEGLKKVGKIDLLLELKKEVYLGKGQVQEALAILTEQFKGRKNKVRYYYQQGRIWRQFKKIKKSKRAFQNALMYYDSIPKRVSESTVYIALKDSIEWSLRLTPQK